MARTKYKEHLQMIEAVQNKGTNLSELEEFAPGLIVVEDGKVFIKSALPDVNMPVNVTDWLIDDPGIGYIVPITDAAFKCRFEAGGGPTLNGDAKAPPFKMGSDESNWRVHLYNQERMIEQHDELMKLEERLIAAMDRMASPERVHGVVMAMATMVEAVDKLSVKMETANGQLEEAVQKLASTFWGLMKIPVAVVVVGAASWAFMYAEKISERTWLVMVAVSVFPWLGDSISAIGKIIRGGGNSSGGAGR